MSISSSVTCAHASIHCVRTTKAMRRAEHIHLSFEDVDVVRCRVWASVFGFRTVELTQLYTLFQDEKMQEPHPGECLAQSGTNFCLICTW